MYKKVSFTKVIYITMLYPKAQKGLNVHAVHLQSHNSNLE